ncbi:MAG: hypothetical protein AAB709_01790 [Patescibacteria group bacterium]
MGIEDPQQRREITPTAGFESIAASFEENVRALDELLGSKKNLSPEEQKVIDALRDNLTIHGPTL